MEVIDSLRVGGAERMILDLTMCLKARGHLVQIVCLRTSGPLEVQASEAGIEVVAMGKGDGFSISTFQRMVDIFRRWRPDVVHTHNPLVHHYGSLAGRLTGAAGIVSTIHGINNISLKPGFREMVYGLSSPLTDRVVAVCPAAGEHFRHSMVISNHKLAVIDNGVPLEPFLKIPPRSPNGEFVFGAVGRLVPVKDHISLLEAFSKLGTKYPRCRLEILGEGPLRPILEAKITALNLHERVQLRGYSADVPGFLSRVHTFVMSSISEGLPLTILEAMASGLPVVATDVGGVAEVVSKSGCGWLCPPSAPDRLADALLAALESSDRGILGDRARTFAEQGYSVSRMTTQYEHLFEELVCKQRSRTMLN